MTAQPPALRLDERRLAAALNRWARQTGWDRLTFGHGRRSPDGRVQVAWDDHTLTVDWRDKPGDAYARHQIWVAVTSIREAADMLAALGVTPTRLAPLWMTGWHAATTMTAEFADASRTAVLP